ncbi:helix-turn-helix domain-containing protein [Varibaculum cambriense]|uniref:helix-turn-helix domain-containing protein n=1 Tax=Varibaculum cambriense TaxID=184870 RepID=UPI00241C9F68|nr:helix-turn-helix transcriptional regulator [Varibaculum cambriense]MBS5944925.1 helix-turn-helix transcriptional regulator [Varibaculum cambriense]
MDMKMRGELFAMILAARLKEVFDNTDINQEALAEKVGTSQPQISLYLRGKRVLPADFYSRICAAMDCDPAEIVDRAYNDLLDLEAGKRLDPRIIPVWKLAAKNPGYTIDDQLKGEEDNQP